MNRNFKSGESLSRTIIVAIAVSLFSLTSLPAFAYTQQIVLEAGWNLISVQVGTVWTVNAIENAIDAPGILKAVWGYDAEIGTWRTYQPTMPGFPNDLDAIVPGRGYWVEVCEACVLTLDDESWEDSVELRPGWNLVGFPGLGSFSLASFFGNELAGIQQVWGFEGGAVQKFTGYDVSGVPQRKELYEIAPGRGYWVYALNAVTLASHPEILLTGDIDMPPLQAQRNYVGEFPTYIGRKVKLAGVEDIAADLNGNGILDDSETQDTVMFGVGVQRQPIIIGNGGAGALNWSVTEDCDWLSVDGVASGTVAGASAYVYLVVDRKGLSAGCYTNNSVVITAGGVSKSVTVIMNVATVDGDFKGYASATHVNGKEIALGKVDMGLNVFVTTNTTSGTRFKAVIDNDNSLLFPRDVFMNGIFYLGNSFSLTTSFSMPAGDRNAPPYDTFEHVDPGADQEGFSDRDWNTNGVLDVENPFPFAVRRSVTLLGQRTDENTLEGSYMETIAGALPNNEKICIEGNFSLTRQTYSPKRRGIYNLQDSEYEVIGKSNASFSRTLTITEAVQVNGVTSTLNIDYPRPEALTITLTSPAGTVATLHDKGASVAATVELSGFDGENGKGDWTLEILWDTSVSHGERGRYWSWLLNIGGIATYSVSGRLVDENGVPLSGAVVTLSGSNEIGSQTTDNAGNFTLSGLTENEYGLAVMIPGRQSTSSSFQIDSGDINLSDICVPSMAGRGLNGIHVSPALGFVPLDVQFTVGVEGVDVSEINNVDWFVSPDPIVIPDDPVGGDSSETNVPPVVVVDFDGINATPSTGGVPLDVLFTVGVGGVPVSEIDNVSWLLMVPSYDSFSVPVLLYLEPLSAEKPWETMFHFDEGWSEYVVIAQVMLKNGEMKEYTYGPVELSNDDGEVIVASSFFSGNGSVEGGTVEALDDMGATTEESPSPVFPIVSLEGKPWQATFHFDESWYEYFVTAIVTLKSGEKRIFSHGPVALLRHGGMAAPGAPFMLSNCGFIGGGSGVDVDPVAATTVGMTWTPNILYEQQKRDCAAFDINRWPTNTFDVTKEDTDFFVQPGTPYYRLKHADSKQPCDSFFSEYEQPTGNADRFRIITTLGGYVFGDAPARSGQMMLQTGRIEE